MSAEAALGKSLDDLIAENRQKKDTKQKKEIRKGNKPAPEGRPPRRAPGPAAPRREQPRNLSITVKGGVAKGQRRPGPAPVREEREQREREDPDKRAAALDGDLKWSHDRFSGPRPSAGAARRGPRGPKDPTALGTKLYISNLHYTVTDADIKELFETCGEVVLHKVHYDNSGRSEGTGEVIYKVPADAERAMRRYNNVQLDGNAMQIELIAQAAGGAGGPGGPRTLSSGIRISGERGGTRMVQLTRHFQQAAGGTSRVRGRGSVRSGVAAMQE